MPVRPLLCALVLALAGAVPADALTVLTNGKHAIFRSASGIVRLGRDRALATLVDPICASGLPTTVQVGAYLQSTARLSTKPADTLPCERWRKVRGGYVYADNAGTAGGVRRIVYARDRLVVKLGGAGYTAPGGPVGYVELWLTIGSTRLLARFHNFRVNTATQLVTRKTSRAAAAGEAAFWDVLHGDDRSEARQQAAIRSLGRASRRSKRDGRSRFLLAMMHLYRFGVRIQGYTNVSEEAKAEIRAADDGFAAAVPLLWDGTAGDSRVPGFAAAAKFARGIVDDDEARAASGLSDLDEALRINTFFNVFDLIPVVQALPRTDPRFQPAVDAVVGYLRDPETLACLATQPEICSNDGLAPRNLSGATLLFGDVWAKAGDTVRARTWYGIAVASGDPSYRFNALAQARLADVDARVARYLDDDPSNDDQIVGIGEENCAVCHNK
jgi:hypothetical protein